MKTIAVALEGTTQAPKGATKLASGSQHILGPRKWVVFRCPLQQARELATTKVLYPAYLRKFGWGYERHLLQPGDIPSP